MSFRPIEEISVDQDTKPDFSAIFQVYECHAWLFTPKQFDALALRFRDRLSIAEIAARLKIATSSVSERLGRAKKRLDSHLRRIRRESIELTRDC